VELVHDSWRRGAALQLRLLGAWRALHPEAYTPPLFSSTVSRFWHKIHPIHPLIAPDTS
jgi:hypothetical protein